MRHWHVVFTRPRQERRALMQLQRQGYEAWLPLMPVPTGKRGRAGADAAVPALPVRACGQRGGEYRADTQHHRLLWAGEVWPGVGSLAWSDCGKSAPSLRGQRQLAGNGLEAWRLPEDQKWPVRGLGSDIPGSDGAGARGCFVDMAGHAAPGTDAGGVADRSRSLDAATRLGGGFAHHCMRDRNGIVGR